MRAITVNETGGPEVLVEATVDDPTPADGHLLVRVEAAGINYIDTYHRRGLYPAALPFVPGMEGAGTVLESRDPSFAADDRVAWASAMGSYAELVTVPATVAVAVHPDVGLPEAAAVMLQGMTAHYLARDTFRLGPGSRCLIHAGAGGVGLLLIQIAKRFGAEVFSTVSTEEKAALAIEAGADHIVTYDGFESEVEDVAGPRPLDVVYDGVGAATFDRGLGLLRKRGMMVLFGQASGPVPPVDLQVLNQHGSLFATRPTLFDYIADRSELEQRASEIFGWLADGSLAVRIGQTWPLAEAAGAHRALESRATVGKSLLLP